MNIQHTHIETNEDLLDIPQYIDQPNFVKKKAGCYLLQMTGWTIWTSLFIPIVTIVLWLYQGRLIKNYLFAEDLQVQLWNLFWLAVVIGICCTLLLLWAGYNWIRYRHSQQQKQVANVTQRDLAADFLVTPQQLSALQNAKNIVLHYDQQGILSDYELRKRIC